MGQRFIFSEMQLDDGLVRDLRRMNPWWEDQPQPALPTTRRHLVGDIQRRLEAGLAPIVAVCGSRQIGKTVAQRQVLQDLLDAGTPPRNILRVQLDDLPELHRLSEPVLRLVDWYESTVLGRTLNEAAQAGEKTYLFFDEVQNVKRWAPQLKSLVDNCTTQVVATGSTALRVDLGRDSLAGRISSIEAGALSLTEIGSFHGIDLGQPVLSDGDSESLTKKAFWRELAAYGRSIQRARDDAFRWFSERGGYPAQHKKASVSWSRLASQLAETAIKRVLQHDLRAGAKGRKRDPRLLEEVFRLACRYAGQFPAPALFARELRRTLKANVGHQRVRSYLRFLEEGLLLRLVAPWEIRLKKKRGNAMICLADHGLRGAWLQEEIPLEPERLTAEPELTAAAGAIAKSAAGASLCSIPDLEVAHLPERVEQPAVDFVLSAGTKRIPLEVRYYQRIDALRDTEGLRAFVECAAYNAPFGVLVTQTDDVAVDDPRIVCLPLSSLMLLR